MVDPTLRDVIWGGLAPDVAADLVREALALSWRHTVRVAPSHEQTIRGHQVDVRVEGVTLGRVRELAEWLDERVAGPAEGTPGG